MKITSFLLTIQVGTGFGETIDAKGAKIMGASAFVVKPLVMRDMANTVRNVLGERQA